MGMVLTAEFTCDICGKTASVAVDGMGRAPPAWMVLYGSNLNRMTEAKYVCDVHDLKAMKTEVDPLAVSVIRDSKDVVNALEKKAQPGLPQV